MLDKLTEEGLLSITEAVACFAGWPAASTVRRWARDGIRGHKLDAVVIGHRLFTSRPAIERFIAATTAAAGISKP